MKRPILACHRQSARGVVFRQSGHILSACLAQQDPPFRKLQLVFTVGEVIVIFNDATGIRQARGAGTLVGVGRMLQNFHHAGPFSPFSLENAFESNRFLGNGHVSGPLSAECRKRRIRPIAAHAFLMQEQPCSWFAQKERSF